MEATEPTHVTFTPTQPQPRQRSHRVIIPSANRSFDDEPSERCEWGHVNEPVVDAGGWVDDDDVIELAPRWKPSKGLAQFTADISDDETDQVDVDDTPSVSTGYCQPRFKSRRASRI